MNAASLLPTTHLQSAASRTAGVCSSSARVEARHPWLSSSASEAGRRSRRSDASVVRTIAPERDAAAFWAAQVQQDNFLDRQNRAELEALRRSLNASMNTTVRKPQDAQAVKDDAAPSLGWRWLPHQQMPDALWAKMRTEAQSTMESEPYLGPFLSSAVLSHRALAPAIAALLSEKLGTATLPASALMPLYMEAYTREPALVEGMAADLNAAFDRDPACSQYVHAMLHFKGVHALLAHRVTHWLWVQGRKALAHALQSRASEAFHVDIHPGAQLGWGVMMDHATGIVVGETAVVGDNVSMLHHVTLGGSGTGRGIRHPTVGHGVLLGAGVSVLGPIMIGAGSKVGAGSVVVRDLPCHCVAVGVPARIVKYDIKAEPVQDMDQCFDFIQDYVI